MNKSNRAFPAKTVVMSSNLLSSQLCLGAAITIPGLRLHAIAVRVEVQIWTLYETLASHPGWVAWSALAVLTALLLFVLSLAWTGRQQAVIIQRLTERGEELENYLRMLLDYSSDLVFILDGDGNITTWNRAAEKTTGQKAEDIIRLNLTRLTPDIFQGQTQRWLKSVIAGEDPGLPNLTVISRDGNDVVLKVNPKLMRRKGKFMGVLCVARVMKCTEETEPELPRSAADLKWALANLPFTVFTADQGGRVKLLGGKGTRDTGIEPGECEGRLVQDLRGANPLFCKHMEMAQKGKPSACLERSSGYTFSVHHAPVHNEKGDVTGLVGLAINLGGDADAEGTTGSPSRGDSLAAGLRNHLILPLLNELRKPVSSIFAVAELLHQTNLEPEIQECLDVLMFSSQSVLRILEDAGDLAKLDAGELVMEPAEFSLREFLEDSFRPFAAQAAYVGRQLNWKIDPQVPDVYVGDSRRLRQALNNIVSYSLDCLTTGGVLVWAQTGSIDEEEAVLSFKVEGTGLLEDEPPPSSGSTVLLGARHMNRSDRQGAIASLRLAKGLIELMGGAVAPYDNSGNGTVLRFWVRLKRIEPCRGAMATRSARALPRHRLARPGDAEKNTAGGKPILIEGFKDQAQANLSASLQDCGHAVVAVEDESEMLALLEKYNWGGFQLLVLRHGGMSGSAKEVVEFIRQRTSEVGNDLPILLMSPAELKCYKGEVEELAVAARLKDPVDELVMVDMIETLCGKYIQSR